MFIIIIIIIIADIFEGSMRAVSFDYHNNWGNILIIFAAASQADADLEQSIKR